ncbi:MAG: hypothetical protein HY689_02915 [Chloroflexi bacterium]|nr:hypothetical protein [Chloroflexota bacterium]
MVRAPLCRRHWRLVPKLLRDPVLASYRPNRVRPAPAWVRAATAAIRYVRSRVEENARIRGG